MVRFRCHHPGCSLNKWSQRTDPAPEEVHRDEESVAITPIPTQEEIPQDYMGDTLYWYRDINGSYLFANRRINLSSNKLYVPFVYTLQGFVTGKNAKWPKNFNGLYGAETIKGKSKVIIVEGEKAAEAAKKLFPEHAVVSWLGGANRGYEEADWSVLKDIHTALLWPDNDEPGKQVMRAIARKLPCAKILIADVSGLPPKSDLADNISKDLLSNAIKNAFEVSTKIPGVFSLDEIKSQLTQTYKTRNSGYDVLDSHTKLPGSGLLVIEGRTKHGKSALAVALTSAMLRRNLENNVLFYSYEMTAAKVFMRYLKSIDPEVSPDNYESSAAYNEIAHLLSSGRLQIVDQSAQLSIADVVVSASKPQVRGGIIVVDYLQIVPMYTSYGKNSRQVMLKEMLDELRVAAHKNNVLVLVLSQLTPDYADPRHDSPREAKDIHYSADLVFRIWNKAVGDRHPAYDNVGGDYVVHTYLNRDGESNVLFEGSLEGGSKLSIKRRVRLK